MIQRQKPIQLDIKQWQPRFYYDRKQPFATIISASRNSGKSILVKYLYKNIWKPKKFFDVVIIFSKTLCNGFYQQFIDTKLLYDKYVPEALHSLQNIAKKYMHEGKRFNFLCILDDSISLRQKYDEPLTDMFTQGRHYGASIVFITQKLSYASLTWVNNATEIIIMRNRSPKELEYIGDTVLCANLGHIIKDRNKRQISEFCRGLQHQFCLDYNALVCLPLSDDTPVCQFRANLSGKSKKVVHRPEDINPAPSEIANDIVK